MMKVLAISLFLKRGDGGNSCGILADDMGMGKTIEAISLVLTSRDLRLRSGSSSSTFPATLKTTLVICPRAALMQWVKEIRKCTKTGTATVFVYHGPHWEEGNVDFGNFGSDIELQSHRRTKCELFASKTNTEHKRKKQHPGFDGMSLLHLVRWKRIILDEAHDIKNRQTVSAKVVCSLDLEYKWVIGGTPLQNKLGDLYSLIWVLQVFPYSYYFCQNSDCRELDYGSLEDCTTCEQSKEEQHFNWWNEYITDPILQHSNEVSSKKAMTLLGEFVLRSVLLRRTKEDRGSETILLQKYVIITRDTLDEPENHFYATLEAAICYEYNISAHILPLTILQERGEIRNMIERDAFTEVVLFSQNSQMDQY